MKNNKLLKWIRAALPHLSLVLSIYFIVMVILNDYNPSINLLANPYNVTFLTISCVVNLLHAFVVLTGKRNDENEHTETVEALSVDNSVD